MIKIDSLLELNSCLFYYETAAVFRYDMQTKKIDPVEELAEIPCRISLGSRDDNGDRAVDHNPIGEAGTLFCAPKWPIKAGDTLDITRDKQTTRWIAGEPVLYPHSQQVAIMRRSRA